MSMLLLAAICFTFFGLPTAHSQMNTPSMTTTIQTPPTGQCSVLGLAFSAKANQVIGGTFGSDTVIDFYILSQSDFNALSQENTCGLPYAANPLFDLTGVWAYDNAYGSTPIPTSGIYYFVFVYHNNGIAELTSGYATVELTYPSFVTILTQTPPNGTINANTNMTQSIT
jgi:hypothetical protein